MHERGRTSLPAQLDVTDSGGARLRYGSDDEPGIRRHGRRRFRYVEDGSGRPPAAAELDRIRSLAIPPAWTDVWIAADGTSHVQATGRDAKGRKQYRYHPAFVAARAADKFAGLAEFGGSLGRLRRRVRRDLARPGLDVDRVVASVVRLLDVTSLRVGNAEYASANGSYGLTTLRNRHAVVHGGSIQLRFPGKSGHEFDVCLDDPRLARVVRRCQDLPGQALFTCRADDGEVRVIGSSDVNRYLGEHASTGATAKTFRTWNGTLAAAVGLAADSSRPAAPSTEGLNAVIDDVAAELGNTRAVCRASYIHPVVIEAYLDGTLGTRWDHHPPARPTGVTADERRLLRLLRPARR